MRGWLSVQKMEKSKGEQTDKDSFERPRAAPCHGERGEGPRCWGHTWHETRSLHRAPTCEQDGEADHNRAADEDKVILLESQGKLDPAETGLRGLQRRQRGSPLAGVSICSCILGSWVSAVHSSMGFECCSAMGNVCFGLSWRLRICAPFVPRISLLHTSPACCSSPSSAEVACCPSHYLHMGFLVLGFELLGRVECCASHHPHRWMFLSRLLVLERVL